jgi:hypothetical protein
MMFSHVPVVLYCKGSPVFMYGLNRWFERRTTTVHGIAMTRSVLVGRILISRQRVAGDRGGWKHCWYQSAVSFVQKMVQWHSQVM